MKKQNNSKNFDNEIKKLKESPVFALTLGAKELCHSNFWKWLIDKDKNFAKVFFKEIDVDKIDSVSREKEHMDLVVETKNGDYIGGYIIENKLKSLPDKEQLENYKNKYASKKERHFVCGKVTGISKPSFVLPNGWDPLSYEEILDGIEKMYQSANLTGDDKIVVKEYIESSKSMLYVIDESCKAIGNTMDCSKLDKMSKIKLDDIVKKLQADRFAHFLNENIRKELEKLIDNNSWEVVIKPGFTRKDSLVDVRFKKEENEDELSLGIQIQGDKFKRIVSTTKVAQTSKKQKAEKLFEKYHAMGWLKSYDASTKMVFNKKTQQTKDYCSYVTDKYTLVYQYFDIEDYKFTTLMNEIFSHLNDASKIIKDNNL